MTFTVPAATAVSEPLAVAGFSARPAVPPAVIVALMLMLLAAVSVSVLALHSTVSLTLRLPVPAAAPVLDSIVTLPLPS